MDTVWTEEKMSLSNSTVGINDSLQEGEQQTVSLIKGYNLPQLRRLLDTISPQSKPDNSTAVEVRQPIPR